MTDELPMKIVRCPACGGDSVFAATNRWRPFCSERCKQVDLGAWASGGYALPAEQSDSEADPTRD